MELKDLVFKWKFVDGACVCIVKNKVVAKIAKTGLYDWWVIKESPHKLPRCDRLWPYLDEAKDTIEDLIRTEMYVREHEKKLEKISKKEADKIFNKAMKKGGLKPRNIEPRDTEGDTTCLDSTSQGATEASSPS